MHATRRIGLGLIICALIGGCRAATTVIEVPRVDLQLDGSGNRGYLVGAPPPAPAMKTTRQMLKTDIEVPGFYTPKGVHKPVSLEQEMPEAPPIADAPAAPPREAEETYVVRKGDTLWSIAAQPAIYGKATHWRRIFDANRDLLKSPDRLKAGMTLRIPRGEAGDDMGTDDVPYGK